MFGWFAYCEATDSIPFGIYVGHKLCTLLTQVLVHAPLYDGKQGLVVAIEGLGVVEYIDTSLQPIVGQMQAFLSIIIVCCAWRTFVEGHHNVGTNDTLNIHHFFGCEEVLATINMRTKFAPFGGQFSNACQ